MYFLSEHNFQAVYKIGDMMPIRIHLLKQLITKHSGTSMLSKPIIITLTFAIRR